MSTSFITLCRVWCSISDHKMHALWMILWVCRWRIIKQLGRRAVCSSIESFWGSFRACEKESTFWAGVFFSFRWNNFAGLGVLKFRWPFVSPRMGVRSARLRWCCEASPSFFAPSKNRFPWWMSSLHFFSFDNSKGNKARASQTSLQLPEPTQTKTTPNRNMTSTSKKYIYKLVSPALPGHSRWNLSLRYFGSA